MMRMNSGRNGGRARSFEESRKLDPLGLSRPTHAFGQLMFLSCLQVGIHSFQWRPQDMRGPAISP